MQSTVDSLRADLTTQEVIDIIQANVLEYDFGLELLDANDEVIEDISEDFAGGTIAHDMQNLIHGTARLTIAREINWYNQRVLPYCILDDGVSQARFNLGVYLPVTPRRITQEQKWEVECYDKLLTLSVPYGSPYQLLRSANIIDTVESLIEQAGETSYDIDLTAREEIAITTRTWDVNNETTYLSIINDLLLSIGYKPLWVDQDGVFRSGPQELLDSRESEWSYSTADPYTTVYEDITQEIDFFDVPNKFRFYRNDPLQTLPVEGDGIYTVTNQSDGNTSIDSRGRTILKTYQLEVNSQAALIVQGDKIVEMERQLSRTINLSTSINPLHLHDDCVDITDSDLDEEGTLYLVDKWELDLNNGRMTLELKTNG